MGFNLPTKSEADYEGMKYKHYADLFFAACNRPWGEVEEAQGYLIDILDFAKELEITAFGTNLRMSIDGYTFHNSTVKRNIPGSEVFSAPYPNTLNGRLFLPYRLCFDDRIIPNLYLEFVDGKVDLSKVATGGLANMEWVMQVLQRDDGASMVGEVALGTNPAFKKAMVNPLYTEKVAGSFHIALGRAYDNTVQYGRKVTCDNGVDSGIHIDLACMMLPRYGGGEVKLDGMVIQRDGRFLDPRLRLLNPTKK